MKIGEMHIMFRQFAQQMGMQNVMSILPEQIDLLLNTSIVDTTNALVRSTIGVATDRVVVDSSRVLQIDSLAPLYKSEKILFCSTGQGSQTTPSIYRLDTLTPEIGHFYFDSSIGSTYELPEFMYVVGFTINYVKTDFGFDGDGRAIGKFRSANCSKPYPVRIIQQNLLAEVLNDAILKPKMKSPIIVVNDNSFDLYIDKFIHHDDDDFGDAYRLKHDMVPVTLMFSYIAYPDKVKYADDIDSSESVDCNLPEHLHDDIVKHAVDLYRITINNTTFQQTQANASQQADASNNK